MGNQQRSVEDRPSKDDIVLSLKNQPTSTNRSSRKKSVAVKQLKRELEVNMKLRRPQTSSTDASATSANIYDIYPIYEFYYELENHVVDDNKKSWQ
ncbi:unnamed protein product [Closterium sp. NIES-53]